MDIELLEELTGQIKKYRSKYKSLLTDYNNLIQEKENNNYIIDQNENIDSIPNFFNDQFNYELLNEKIHPVIKQIDITDDLSGIQDIVDTVINIKYPIIFKSGAFLEIEKISKSRLSKDSYFRDKTTDFINNQFFKNDETFYLFIRNFIILMEKTLDEYRTKKTDSIKIKYNYNLQLSEENLILLFKGGNTLKSIYEKYMYEQPGAVSEILYEKYNQYFKRSDLDFQIIIHPELVNNSLNNTDLNKKLYIEILEDMKLLSCLVLNRYRNMYLPKLAETFDFYKLNNETKINLLKKLNEELNNTVISSKATSEFKNEYLDMHGKELEYYFRMNFINTTINDIHSDISQYHEFNKVINDITKIINREEIINIIENQYPKTSRVDLYIDPSPSNKDNVIEIYKLKNLNVNNIDSSTIDKIFEDNEIRSEHYISLINNIIINNNSPRTTIFDLARIKVNFMSIFKTDDNKYGIINIPGELIDISISDYKDYKLDKIKNKKLSELFTKYKFSNINNRYNIAEFEYWSYNINSFMEDLEIILFSDNILPWNDIKYNKRLERLMFLIIIELLSLDKIIIADINLLKTFNKADLDVVINNESYFTNINFSDIFKKTHLFELLSKHKTIYNDIKKDLTNKTLNDDKFKEYYTIIQENLNILNKVIEIIDEFNKRTNISKVDVNADYYKVIHQFGGINNKYIKYKSKYLDLLKRIENSEKQI